MIDRRTLLSTGSAASVGALLGAEPASGASAHPDDPQGRVLVARAIDELRESLERQAHVAPALLRVREQQRVFLKANHKFPDFVEVGIGVWEEIADWHLTNQLTPAVRRIEDGRYLMTLAFTALVLRPDQAEGFVGIGFDAE